MDSTPKTKKGKWYYLIFGGLVFDLFLMIKVAPTFKDVFESFGRELPILTKWCIRISDGMQFLNFPGAVVAVAGLVYALLSPFYEDGRFKPKRVKEWMIFLALGLVAGLIFVALFMPMILLGNAVDPK